MEKYIKQMSDDVQSYVSQKGIKYKFIVELSLFLHFLTLNPFIGVPEIDYDKPDPKLRLRKCYREKLLQVCKKGEQMLDNFCKIWKEDYLASLRERLQSFLKESRKKSHCLLMLEM